MKHKTMRLAILAVVVGGGLCGRGYAQLNSSTASVALTATLAESLTVSVTPSSMSFNLVTGGVAAGNVPVAITTTWVLSSGRANLVLDAYFTTPSAALSGGSPVTNIPSSEIFGQMTTGTPTSMTAFTQTGVLGAANGGLALYTVPLTSSNRASTRTDNLGLQIDLTSQPQLPAGTYTGTLYLQAQAL